VKNEKNPYLKAVGDRLEITDEGKKYLNKIATSSDGQVYAFYGNAPPLLVAAAMARLSRRGSDMREIYLDEFAFTGEEDAAGLIHRVVTAFGDDSVQQLVGLHFVVEDASNYLTKLLEWGRFAAYLEQSTRYIFYDEKDKNGNFKYYTPNLDPKTSKIYKKINDEIFTIYSKMVRELTEYVRKKVKEPTDPREQIAWRGATKAQACDAVRPVLPISTKSTVGIFASAQAVESLILNLLAEDLEEARLVGKQILEEARKVIPAFLERADRPDRGGATTAYWANTRTNLRKLATENLTIKPRRLKKESVRLLDYWPKDENDLLPHLLFDGSLLSTEELQTAFMKLSAKKKDEIFKAYIGERLNRRHKPGRVFELPHYLWEIVADYGTFRDLQRHRVVDAMEWQRLTTDYSYEVPALVKEAGLQADFVRCFDLAEDLYRQMVKNGYETEAQYAVLFGHRMRYKFMLNARAAYHFIELRSSPQGHPGYRRIVNKMFDLMSEVHPKISQAMSFVNKDEDPELARMAAELATQYKLEKLDKLKQ
jgi:thymidylate synthase ThyX